MPADDWPGFTARQPISDSECLQLDFATDESGGVAPIVLTRWDGAPILLGPLNTPEAAFYDGQTEWGVFVIGAAIPCSDADAASGAPCSTDLDPAAASLHCAFVDGEPVCIDPTSTQGAGAGAERP